jgi:hypothetical protein
MKSARTADNLPRFKKHKENNSEKEVVFKRISLLTMSPQSSVVIYSCKLTYRQHSHSFI